MKAFLIRLLVWYLARLVDKPLRYEQTIDQELGALAQMYELPAVHRYFDKQEAYLKDLIAEDVVRGRMPESAYYARFMAGRLHEIQLFRDKLATAFAYHKRRRDEKVLASAKKDS
jgi:hypothetical protein